MIWNKPKNLPSARSRRKPLYLKSMLSSYSPLPVAITLKGGLNMPSRNCCSEESALLLQKKRTQLVYALCYVWRKHQMPSRNSKSISRDSRHQSCARTLAFNVICATKHMQCNGGCVLAGHYLIRRSQFQR